MALSSKRGAKKRLLLVACVVVCVAALGFAVGCSGNDKPSSGVDWDKIVAANPDDPFVKSFQSDDQSLEIVYHRTVNNATCETCHKDDQEVAAKVGTMTEIPESNESSVGTREFCLSCHKWEKVKDSVILAGETSIYNKTGQYNVHDNHFGEVDCSLCHGMHEKSTLVCLSCHFLEKPDGWDGFE